MIRSMVVTRPSPPPTPPTPPPSPPGGAGRARLRQQADREGANLKASEQAWKRTIAFLREKMKQR